MQLQFVHRLCTDIDLSLIALFRSKDPPGEHRLYLRSLQILLSTFPVQDNFHSVGAFCLLMALRKRSYLYEISGEWQYFFMHVKYHRLSAPKTGHRAAL